MEISSYFINWPGKFYQNDYSAKIFIFLSGTPSCVAEVFFKDFIELFRGSYGRESATFQAKFTIYDILERWTHIIAQFLLILLCSSAALILDLAIKMLLSSCLSIIRGSRVQVMPSLRAGKRTWCCNTFDSFKLFKEIDF